MAILLRQVCVSAHLGVLTQMRQVYVCVQVCFCTGVGLCTGVCLCSPGRVDPDDVQVAEVVTFRVLLVVAGAALGSHVLGPRIATATGQIHTMLRLSQWETKP